MLVTKLSERSPFFSQWAMVFSYLVFLPVFALFSGATWFLAPFVFGVGLIFFVMIFDLILAKDQNLYHKNIIGVFLINFLATLYLAFHSATLIFYNNSGVLQEPYYDIFTYLIPLGLFVIFGVSWLYRSFYFKSYKLFVEFIIAMSLAVILVYFVLPNAGMIKYKLLGPKHVQIDYLDLPAK